MPQPPPPALWRVYTLVATATVLLLGAMAWGAAVRAHSAADPAGGLLLAYVASTAFSGRAAWLLWLYLAARGWSPGRRLLAAWVWSVLVGSLLLMVVLAARGGLQG